MPYKTDVGVADVPNHTSWMAFALGLVLACVSFGAFGTTAHASETKPDTTAVHTAAAQPDHSQRPMNVAPRPTTVRYCGIITCTDYASRSEARTMAANIRRIESTLGNVWSLTCGGLGVMAGAISSLVAAPVVWIACEGFRSRMASITNTIKAAADNGQCVAISFARYGSNNLMAATGWWRYNCNWG